MERQWDKKLSKGREVFIVLSFIFGVDFAFGQQVDYSVVSVPEETGVDFTKITKTSDYVALPQVRRNANGVKWLSNRIIDISPDGTTLAYLSARNNTTNIFLTDVSRQGSSVQRTNRTGVLDFSFSPDGKKIVFSESKGNTNQIFTTDASKGYVCRQITSSDKDYSPIYSWDMKYIFFCRAELRGASIWSYDVANNFLSSYFNGMNPCLIKGSNEIVIARSNAEGRSEIWKVNYSTGAEECLVSDADHSFTSPIISPDGKWILFVGDGHIFMSNGGVYHNTDLFVARIDGTQMTQLTYHASDDLSPIWSRDGKYIYFISQRGDSSGVGNIWRMTFNEP